MALRCVTRLEGNHDVLGLLPQEWQELGVTPADLGLEDGEWYIDVDESSRDQRLTIEQAVEHWPIGPWVGLCVEYDLPPGHDGFPSMFGACWWRIWHGVEGWCHSASLEYPARSVQADERWPAWLRAFISAAETEFDATATSTP